MPPIPQARILVGAQRSVCVCMHVCIHACVCMRAWVLFGRMLPPITNLPPPSTPSPFALLHGGVLRGLSVQHWGWDEQYPITLNPRSPPPPPPDPPAATHPCTTARPRPPHTHTPARPFPWDSSDGSHGGFAGAARSFLEGNESAEMEAISRTARHRLERGIWTSPGAGDLRWGGGGRGVRRSGEHTLNSRH